MKFRYNHVTGIKEDAYPLYTEPEDFFCEKCGKRTGNVGLTGVGHYHYLCSKCRKGSD